MSSSRLQQRLDAELAACTEPGPRALLRAERACLLARQGGLAEAEAERVALRTEHEARPQAALRIWLKLLDGILGYYTDAMTHSRPAFSQALALAHQARLRPLGAEAAVWMAQMAFVDDEIEPMVRWLAEALQDAQPGQHAVRARAAALVAVSYHYAFRLDRAQPWYLRAQQHANADGDAQMLSGLMYMRAWTSGNQVRLAGLFGTPMPENEDAIRQALLHAQSSGHFDRRLGVRPLRQLVPLLDAQLLTHHGDWAEADRVFADSLDAPDELAGVQRYRALLLGDWAWCRQQLGDVESARRLAAQAAEALVSHPCAQDDLTAAHGRLAQLHEAFGEPGQADEHRRLAQAELATLQANQARTLAALDQALAQVLP